MALERKEAGIYEGEGLNTQQVIHRALNVASEDNDFLETSAWLSVVREGYLELPEYTDLATVTNLPNLSRVKLVSYRIHICYFDVFMVQLILFFFLGCRIGENHVCEMN